MSMYLLLIFCIKPYLIYSYPRNFLLLVAALQAFYASNNQPKNDIKDARLLVCDSCDTSCATHAIWSISTYFLFVFSTLSHLILLHLLSFSSFFIYFLFLPCFSIIIFLLIIHFVSSLMCNFFSFLFFFVTY